MTNVPCFYAIVARLFSFITFVFKRTRIKGWEEGTTQVLQLRSLNERNWMMMVRGGSTAHIYIQVSWERGES